MGRDLDNSEVMNQFLAGIEGRALRIAQIATSNMDDGLDLVQDAMMKLVQNYSQRPADEWGPLFHQILQSKIKDWYRKQAVRNRFRSWFSVSTHNEDLDPIDNHPDTPAKQPCAKMDSDIFGEQLDEALGALPRRQQQAFLLRSWEGLSVAETAQAMGCSQGSVKTHYSRAVHKLRDDLEAFTP